jgi:TatD DNase family protein
VWQAARMREGRSGIDAAFTDAAALAGPPHARRAYPTGLLVDTHCHLHLLEPAPEEVVAGALAEGVGHLVDVGVDLASSRRAAANAARLPQVSATAGVHPHDAAGFTEEALGELRRLLADERVVGVGETGLDYYRDNSPRDAQRAAFAAHVRLARELDKALVVHCRDAFPDVLAVLDGEGAPPRVVFHCFAGDERAATRVVEAGWYVSFAGTVTFRNAPGLRAACAVVPLDRMVLETDSPFLSPHPYRGRPNRPGRVAVTAQTVAQVHRVAVEEVAAATTATAVAAFRLDLDGRA